MRRILAILFLWAPFCVTVTAATAASPEAVNSNSSGDTNAETSLGRYTLTSLVDLALRSDLLSAAKARVKERHFAAQQARRWPASSLDLSAGRKREASDSGPRYEAAISQPLPLLGKPSLRGRLLDLETEAGQVEYTGSEIEVTLNVVRLAYEYALDRRKAEFTEGRQKRFELIQSYMAGRVYATPQQVAERRIVQNRLRSVASEALQSQAAFKGTLGKLKVYVPFEAGQYPDVEIPWLSGQRILDEAERVAKALANNPDLRLQGLSVKSAEVEKTLASREALPDPSLIGSYEQAKAAETEQNVGLGVGLALPPWNRNRAGIESAEQKRIAEERLLAFQKQKLTAEIAQALIEYEAARQVVRQYPQERLAELQVQLREAEEGFRKGQVDLLTFLELDSSADETFDRVLESQLLLITKVAEIYRLSGERDILAEIDSF